ncbi:LysR family transcriptional regulator [Saccharomonospora marina]|nr:LysR substrate-binding domain-containing protein [Saccharomonospora marina]
MELRQLRYFVTVAEEASFTRAAAKLHVAQPGISSQIQRLERELGQPLLERSARSVRLTQVGEAVLPHARAALAAEEGARSAVGELTGLLRGRVALGAIPSCAVFDLPGLLAGFHDRHRAVEITLSESRSDVLFAGLRSGELDVAVAAYSGTEPPPGIEARVLADEPLVAAVATTDPLAAFDAVALADLRDRAFITLPPGPGIRSALDEGCAAAGFRPRIAFEASDPAMLAELARRGLGVALLPESAIGERPGELHGLELTRPRLRGCVSLVWRSGGPGGPAARAFLRYAVDTLTPGE